MKSLNLHQIIGHVGQDPDTRTTSSGTVVAQFSVATNDGWGDNERTNWHTVKAFGPLAEKVVQRFVRKGGRVYVSGRLDHNKVTGDDGTTRYYADLVADQIILLDGKDGEPSMAAPAAAPDSSLPF